MSLVSNLLRMTENVSSDKKEYYTEEACAYFAIALSRRFGYEIGVFVDNTNRWSSSIPSVIHVFCYKDGKAIDVLGIEDYDHYLNRWRDSYHEGEIAVEVVSESELRRRFMGNTDSKPLYGYSASEIREAASLIEDHIEKYTVAIDKKGQTR